MCEASAYLLNGDQEELVMESVDILEPVEEGTFLIQNIFGEQKVIKARILRMELVDHRILFDPCE